jgi:hypothetical protein
VRLTVTAEADTLGEATHAVVQYVEDMVRWTRVGFINRDAPGESSGWQVSPSGRVSYVLNVDRDAPVGDDYHERLRQWADNARTKPRDEEGA